MNFLASIGILGILIFLHESGHFLAAILQGIRVNGFSIGFGPSLIKKEFKGVTYSLRALPLGGFVSFPDEETDSDISKDDPDLLRNRPIHQRAFVISAGVIVNLFIAWIVLIGQASFIGLPNQPDPGVLIISVQAEEAAEKSGLAAGDQILGINGQQLETGQKAVLQLVKEVKEGAGKTIKLERLRGETKSIIDLKPTEFSGKGRIGAQLQTNINAKLNPSNDLREIFQQSNNQFIDLLNKTIKGYQGLITDFGTTAQQLSGPIKIVEIGAQLSKQGISGLIFFTALISINLAVLNSLPLPLLDGGQLTLLLIEGFRGKPIPEKIQIAFMQSGFILLVGLSLVLIIRDTSQLSLVQQLIKR